MTSPSLSPSRPSLRIEIIITVLGLLGILLALSLYSQAFPSAAIRLQLSRPDAARQAETVLQELGYDPAGYTTALGFYQDSLGSIYMQRVLGIAESNNVLRSERMPTYYWYARWFKPLQQEEFNLSLSPDGELIGFSHSIPETAPGASLAQEEARQAAEHFLRGQAVWKDGEWELVSASSQERPGERVDHDFTWKRLDLTIGESELRLSVSIQGDEVGYYDYWMKIPEAFRRDFSTQRNLAGFINNTAYTIGLLGFSVAAVIALLSGILRGIQPTRRALLPAAIAGGISLLSELNYLSLARMGYSTTQEPSLFWMETIFGSLTSALFTGVFVLLLWAGGQRISKLAWPMQDRILRRGPNRWEELSRSAWRGIMLGGMMGAYVVLFYLAATRLFGGWTPMDTEYTNLYATPFPFLGALEVGSGPAFTEELLFRLIGISLVLWLSRKRWLALLVPGILWAFAHLTYIRDPLYLRGIELTITAVFLTGLFFLKFDLATTIMAHFVYNAGLTALPMLRSGEFTFVLNGLLVLAVMLAPVLPGLAIALRRKLGRGRAAPAEPQVVPAAPADIEGLAALPAEGVDWGGLLANPRAVVVCLRSGETIAGAAAGVLKEAELAEVLGVWVRKEWRGQYWGSRLAAALYEALQERGAKDVQTTLAAGNRAGLSFWASQGWRPTSQVLAYTPAPDFPQVWRQWVEKLKRKRRADPALTTLKPGDPV